MKSLCIAALAFWLAACSSGGSSGGGQTCTPGDASCTGGSDVGTGDATDTGTTGLTGTGTDTTGTTSTTATGTTTTVSVQTPVATTRTLSSAGAGLLSALYDPGTGTFVLSLPAGTLAMSRFSIADNGAMFAMRDAAGIHNAYFGQGSGTEVIVYSGGLAGNVLQAAAFQRTAATELPLSGAGQFLGKYAGFSPTRRITGNARLDVDFGTTRMEGFITDRTFRFRPDNTSDPVNPLSDMRLDPTFLAQDGTFSGRTSGGQIVGGQVLWNTSSGAYNGLIGGADAREAVGTLKVIHNATTGATYEEVGGFFATR